jgi:hypothetical protein
MDMTDQFRASGHPLQVGDFLQRLHKFAEKLADGEVKALQRNEFFTTPFSCSVAFGWRSALRLRSGQAFQRCD